MILLALKPEQRKDDRKNRRILKKFPLPLPRPRIAAAKRVSPYPSHRALKILAMGMLKKSKKYINVFIEGVS